MKALSFGDGALPSPHRSLRERLPRNHGRGKPLSHRGSCRAM